MKDSIKTADFQLSLASTQNLCMNNQKPSMNDQKPCTNNQKQSVNNQKACMNNQRQQGLSKSINCFISLHRKLHAC